MSLKITNKLIMALNASSNSTNQIINSILNEISTIFFSFLVFILICLCIQSFIWSFYILNRLFRETKNFKYIQGLKSSIHGEEWITRISNSNRKKVKNTFLYLISSIEWILTLLVLFLILRNNSKFIISDPNFINSPLSIDISNTLYEVCNSDFLSKLFACFAETMLLLHLTLIRVLTQYLCEQYSYFTDKSIKFSRIFKRRFAALILLNLLGLIRATICIQWVFICIYAISEFCCYTKATITLSRLLYKRYFDARIHEHHRKSVVRYYRMTYLEFKYGSFILVTSFFTYILTLLLLFLFSVVWLILSFPNNWIQVLFLNSKITDPHPFPHLYQQQIQIFKDVCSSIELICMCIGWSLLVIPYSFVSIKFCFIGVRSRVEKSRDYPNHDLIRKLIYNHNSQYNQS